MTADEEPPAPAVEDNAADAEQKPERKQFVKRLPRPDQAELRAKVESLEATITAQKQRVESIRSELDGRNRRRANDTESQGIRNQLQELRTQFQQVLAQKQAVRAELDSASKAREALRTQVRGMKGKMEYTTVEKIDEQMARLEQRLQHTSMPLTEEKKVLDDIKKLRASRAGVAAYAEKLDRLSGADECGTIVERLKALDEQLSGIKAQEEGLRKQLSDIRAKEDARNVDVPKLQQERDDAREVIRLSVEKIKQLKAEYREKQEQWWQGEQAWREQRARDKARRDEEYAAIRAEREKDRKARQAELAGDPFNKEITLCEQVQGYLSNYMANDKAAADAAAADKADITPLQGMAIYQKKKIEDDNPYANLEKKSKKGRKAEKNAAKPPAEKPLNHSLDIMGAFAKLSIEAPTSVSKVPAAAEAVKERLAYFQNKRDEKKANPEEGGDAEAEDSSNRAATPKAAPAAAEPFVGGGNEPTPAEAAGGRAAGAGAEPTQNGSAGPAQGAWAPPASSAAEPDSAGEPEDAKAASAGDVSLGLTHSDDGTVKVSLSVGGEGR